MRLFDIRPQQHRNAINHGVIVTTRPNQAFTIPFEGRSIDGARQIIRKPGVECRHLPKPSMGISA